MKLHFLIFVILIGYFGKGQTLEVRDSISHNPIPKVEVLDSHKTWLGKTDNSGKVLVTKSYQNYFILNKQGYPTKKVIFKPHLLTTDSTIYLGPESLTLNTLTIEGVKWKSKKNNTPSSVLTLTSKDVEFNQPATTADVLAQSGEVFIQKSQLGGGSPMIRGFAANRILIVVDGIRMNNAIFRSGNVQNVLGVDAFSIDKTHVVLGPGSVLYGSDAMGGVLDFSTKNVSTSAKTNIQGTAIGRYATAAKEKTFHTDLSISNPKWTSFTSFTYSSFDDLKMGKHGPKDYLRNHFVVRQEGKDIMLPNPNPLIQRHSGYQQENFIQKIGFEPHDNLKIEYSLSYAKTSNIPRYDRLIRYKNHLLQYAEWFYGPQDWIQNALHIRMQPHQPWADEFTTIVGHQYFKESRHQRNYYALFRTNRTEQLNVWSWDNAFYKKWNNHTELFYGLDAQWNYINSYANKKNIYSQEQTLIASRYPNKSRWNQWGIYAKNVWKLNRKIHIESGLRYSYVTSTSSFDKTFYDFPFDNADFTRGALSGSIGSAIKLEKGFNLKLNAATGFRAPNMDDIAKVFDSEPGRVVVPNPHLKPEYIYSLEASLSKKIGNFALINLNGYHSWLSQALVRRDFTLNGKDFIMYDGELSRVQAIQNASKAKVYGGLLSIEFKIYKDLKFLGHLNYTYGQEELEDGSLAALRHTAPLFGKTLITYKKKWGKIGIEMFFNGEISANELPVNEQNKAYLYALDKNGNPYVPSYQVFNLKSQWNISNTFKLNLGIENIGDKRYRPYSSGISAPGRNFVISVQTLF